MSRPMRTALPLMFSILSACNFNAPVETKFNVIKNDQNTVQLKLNSSGTVGHSPLITINPLSLSSIRSDLEHIEVTFTINDAENNVVMVELFSNGVFKARDITPPFSFNSSIFLKDGKYNLQVKATDAQSMTGISNIVPLTVAIMPADPNTSGMKKIPVRLGDRHYVGHILEDIFGASNPSWNFAGKTNIQQVIKERYPKGSVPFGYKGDLVTEDARFLIENYIFKDSDSFGGTCEDNRLLMMAYRFDPLYPSRDRNSGLTDGGSYQNHPEYRREACLGSNTNQLTRLSRDSVIMFVCEEISKRDLALNHAIGLVNGSISIEPTPAQIQGIFELFYPNLTFDDELKVSLNGVVATKTTAKEKWKVLINGVCQSAYWQVID